MRSIWIILHLSKWHGARCQARMEVGHQPGALAGLAIVDTEDAIIHQVSSSNRSMCICLWNERKVFDIGSEHY